MPYFPSMFATTMADATTTLLVAHAAGSMVLMVQSQMGFMLGRQIIVDEGTMQQEVLGIANFGSIILTAPLRFAHKAGASVVMPKVGPGPAPGPFPGPAPVPAPLYQPGLFGPLAPTLAPGPAPVPSPFLPQFSPFGATTPMPLSPFGVAAPGPAP